MWWRQVPNQPTSPIVFASSVQYILAITVDACLCNNNNSAITKISIYDFAERKNGVPLLPLSCISPYSKGCLRDVPSIAHKVLSYKASVGNNIGVFILQKLIGMTKYKHRILQYKKVTKYGCSLLYA